jgi:hypothetical protein
MTKTGYPSHPVQLAGKHRLNGCNGLQDAEPSTILKFGWLGSKFCIVLTRPWGAIN